MTKENGITAGAITPSGEFSCALQAHLAAVRDRTAAAEAYQRAEAAYVKAVNKLPVPFLMQQAIVTDADSIKKVRVVLNMTITGPDAAETIEQRVNEIVEYREAKAEIAREHRLDDLGNAALAAAGAAQKTNRAVWGSLPAALEPATWDDAVRNYETAWQAWDALEGDYSNEESEAAGDIALPAKDALIAYPAPDGAAILYKLRVLCDGDPILDEEARLLLADAERLFSGEAQA